MERRTIGLVIGLFVLAFLDLAVLPVLGAGRLIDPLLIAVVVIGGRTRPGVAALAGFALGLVRDSTVPDVLGASALALSVVGYGVARLAAGAFEERVAATAVGLALAKLVADVLFVLVAGRLHGSALLIRLVWWAPIGALLTTMAGLVVLRLLPAPADRRRGVR